MTLADSAEHPARVHAHLPGEEPRRIETFNDRVLAGVQLGRTEERWFQGALGDEVQMWLSYPPGFDAKKRYPLLHVIHGGPHAAAGDGWHYRWNTPLFAAQGYVVCSVNYHGSSGFGYAFLDSITHRYGQLELQDIEAATDVLLQQPWADAKRVFAAGGSYGGYLVAWMNGHAAPGRYQAYVCHAGCFDWTAMFADDSCTLARARVRRLVLGRTRQGATNRARIAFAANMLTPTLVVHGALDYRVPDAAGSGLLQHAQGAQGRCPAAVVPRREPLGAQAAQPRLWYAEFFAWLKDHDPGSRTRKRP